MSAVAAILRYDGGCADTTRVEALLAAMRRRGPDRVVVRGDGATALGCGLLAADGGGLAADGDILAAFDGRLDERETLCARLGASSGGTDAALVIAAWRRWGEESAGELRGDFAFVLWDGGRRRLFAACDGFAVRTVAYAAAPGRVAFASDPVALHRLGFGEGLDDTAIATLLSGTEPNPDATPYRGIVQLAPGHACTVDMDGRLRLRRYWSLSAPEPRPRADAPGELRALLTQAVRDRLGPPAETASLLSGGLDSSSITCIAADLRRAAGSGPLRTYSMVFDRTPEHGERPYIEAVLARGGCDPVMIDADDLRPFAAFDDALDAQDVIFLTPNYAATQLVHRAARAGGTRVLLDGHGGDEAISHGAGLLPELAMSGAWGALWRELSAFSRHQPISVPRHFATYAVQFGLSPRPRRLIRGVVRRWRGTAPEPASFVDADLALRSAGPNRGGANSGKAGPLRYEERFAHLRTLEDPGQTYAFRVLDRAAAAAGLSLRFPFWDRRVVEFCLSLPAGEKMADGVTRLALRRAMQGVLPREVQWRPDKLDFTVHLVRGLVERDRPIVEDVLADRRGDLRGFIDAPAARAAYAALVADPAHPSGRTAFAIWQAVGFGLWRRRLAAA